MSITYTSLGGYVNSGRHRTLRAPAHTLWSILSRPFPFFYMLSMTIPRILLINSQQSTTYGSRRLLILSKRKNQKIQVRYKGLLIYSTLSFLQTQNNPHLSTNKDFTNDIWQQEKHQWMMRSNGRTSSPSRSINPPENEEDFRVGQILPKVQKFRYCPREQKTEVIGFTQSGLTQLKLRHFQFFFFFLKVYD